MRKTKIIDIENDGMNLAVDKQYLYMRGNRSMYKYDLANMRMAAEKVVFKKDGKARGFSIFDNFVFLYDFLDLYILNKDDMKLIVSLRLGENLSSDVCGIMWFNSPKAYVKIRNGLIYILDISTNTFDKVQVIDSSFWSDCVAGNRLFVGTVNGELLEIDKDSLNVIRKIQLCKKNIYSIMHEGGLLYTTSQDQTIKVIDANSFETLCVAKKAVTGMVDIVGIYKDSLIVAGERNPLAFWHKKTLQFHKTIDFPQNRNSVIKGNDLFGCDRKIVYKIALDKLSLS